MFRQTAESVGRKKLIKKFIFKCDGEALKSFRKYRCHPVFICIICSSPACYGSTLGSNPDISQKYKNRRHKHRSGQYTQARQKIPPIQKKTHFIFFLVSILFVNLLKRLLLTNLENRAETLRYKICGGNDHVVCCLHHHWDLTT